MSTKKTGIGISLSNDAVRKIDTISDTIGRSRSMVIERIIMSMSEKQMLRHARRTPVYTEVMNETGDSKGPTT